MVNYFDAISLYSWSMNEDLRNQFSEKLSKFELSNVILVHFGLIFMMGVLNFISFKFLPQNSLMQMTDIAVIISFVKSVFFAALFYVFSYYFYKLFFKTDLKLSRYYLVLTYVNLPFILMMVGITLMSILISLININFSYILFIFYLPLLYYGFKSLNTVLYLLKREFNAGEWSFVGVLVLSIVIYYYSAIYFLDLLI